MGGTVYQECEVQTQDIADEAQRYEGNDQVLTKVVGVGKGRNNEAQEEAEVDEIPVIENETRMST